MMDLRLMLSFFICIFADVVSLRLHERSSTPPKQDQPVRRDSERGFQIPFFHFGASKRAVKFYLYSRNSSKSPDLFKALVSYHALVPSSDRKKQLKVVIHGWRASDSSSYCIMLREGLLKHDDVNVITVDWSEYGSQNWFYPVSRAKVPEVAKIVAKVLDNININFKVKLKDIHVIGHSLGAHIAGLAGRMVESGKIGRMTGLDPAGPSFSANKPDERLDTRSASFVDVIHTCATALGLTEPIGHADFYPNNGKIIQPGCGIDITGICSHRRSYYLFLESLENPKAFPAISCPSWETFENERKSCDTKHIVYMGQGTSKSSRGVFYLNTQKTSPFGFGKVW